MDQYSMERWLLDRHQEKVEMSERRVRLGGPASGWRFDVWAAVRLRRLADRLDGGFAVAAGFEAEPAGSRVGAGGS